MYVYESHAIKASSKKTATATVCFLISCFFKDDELIRKSLTGKNGKQCLDADIIESIISDCFRYTIEMKRFFRGASTSFPRIYDREPFVFPFGAIGPLLGTFVEHFSFPVLRDCELVT